MKVIRFLAISGMTANRKISRSSDLCNRIVQALKANNSGGTLLQP